MFEKSSLQKIKKIGIYFCIKNFFMSCMLIFKKQNRGSKKKIYGGVLVQLFILLKCSSWHSLLVMVEGNI